MNKDAINSGDSDDLEALFDSIVKAHQTSNEAPAAAEAAAPAAEAEPEAAPQAAAESVAASEAPPAAAAEAVPFNIDDLPEPAHSMFSKIGQMTRQLHDAMRELGYDKALERAASTIPDARDRLTYIGNMTEQAANRALNAVDTAKPLQDKIESEAQQLDEQWDKLFDKKLSVDEFKVLVQQTRGYLKSVPNHTKATNDQLLEIMMAQDFQDLTGQVIRKVVTMAQEMESQLFSFLVEYSPQQAKAKHEAPDTLTNGPVINADGRTDVVTSQQQVDDLLASLGF